MKRKKLARLQTMAADLNYQLIPPTLKTNDLRG